MMETGNLWLEKISSTYWALHEGMIPVVQSVIENKLQGKPLKLSEGDPDDLVHYDMFPDGTAVLKMHGVMLKKRVAMHGMSGLVPTLDVEASFLSLIQNEDVSRIILDIDSPGGSVDGVAELSDLIYESRGTKPIIAFANGLMASAAYWIGSAADEVYTYYSGSVGSIGTYMMHVDVSKADDKKGIKITYIHAGEHKVIGNPHNPLEPQDQALLQESVNFVNDLFIDGVNRNRDGKVDRKSMEGQVFIGQQAVDNGLVDGIKNFKGLIDVSKTYSFLRKEEDMNLKDVTLDKLKAENPALVNEAKSEAIAENESLKAKVSDLEAKLSVLETEKKITNYALKLGLSSSLNEILGEENVTFESAMDKLIEMKSTSANPPQPAPAPAKSKANSFYETAPQAAGQSVEDELGSSEVVDQRSAKQFIMKRDSISGTQAWRKAKLEYPNLFDTRPVSNR